jgi:class 3 adenylate cyclase
MRHVLPLTEALQEKVLVFVNIISQIVHLTVDEYSGAPNKNMGDAFLLAWRVDGLDKEKQQKLTDLAIMSCIRIVANVSKSEDVAEYTVHEHVKEYFGEGIFKIELGLGLHAGWAIEGASGSAYKIDATYLSPNVNLANHLQLATMHYATRILLTDSVVKRCSPEMAQICRLIDQVITKYTRNQPIRIYTIDLDADTITMQKTHEKRRVNRFKLRQQREAHKAIKWAQNYQVWGVLKYDYDIISMRSTYSEEFFRRFFTAYRNYEAGEWMVARDLFFTSHHTPKYHTPPVNLTKEDWPDDGPTQALLDFMQQHDFVAPQDWKGYRELITRGRGSLL